MTASNQTQFDIAACIGRWQGHHLGQVDLIQTALSLAPRVVVFIGSAYRSRNPKNPFSWQERKEMLLSAMTEEQRSRVSFEPVRDYYDDERWNGAVKSLMTKHTARNKGDGTEPTVALVGFKKDSSSYYLENFPEWSQVNIARTTELDATTIRNVYFESGDIAGALSVLAAMVPAGVLGYLDAWARTPMFKAAQAEHRDVLEYRKKWTAPAYVTADAVTVASRHLLLVQRKGNFGNRQWALPGGFVDPNERVLVAAIRELREETHIGLLDSSIRRSLRGSAVFDHPDRSCRGRLLTHAFHFDFGDMTLPEIRFDPEETWDVRWVPFDELPAYEEAMFEDHAALIDHFVGLFPG